MSNRRMGMALAGGALAAIVGLQMTLAGSGLNFDKLTDDDRAVFAQRFEQEIWPLMKRNGSDGCVGCHSTGKIVAALRLKDDPAKDFRMLLRDGFFLYQDAGSLLARVSETDIERRMPYMKRPWDKKDIDVLRAFTEDLHKKQKK